MHPTIKPCFMFHIKPWANCIPTFQPTTAVLSCYQGAHVSRCTPTSRIHRRWKIETKRVKLKMSLKSNKWSIQRKLDLLTFSHPYSFHKKHADTHDYCLSVSCCLCVITALLFICSMSMPVCVCVCVCACVCVCLCVRVCACVFTPRSPPTLTTERLKK